MKVSELEYLSRIEKPSRVERERISYLMHKNTPIRKKVKRTRPDAPPLWEQLDKVHVKFFGVIEPWTVLRCTKCGSKYHLADLARCECGLEESKLRHTKHLGGFQIGTETR